MLAFGGGLCSLSTYSFWLLLGKHLINLPEKLQTSTPVLRTEIIRLVLSSEDHENGTNPQRRLCSYIGISAYVLAGTKSLVISTRKKTVI